MDLSPLCVLESAVGLLTISRIHSAAALCLNIVRRVTGRLRLPWPRDRTGLCLQPNPLGD